MVYTGGLHGNICKEAVLNIKEGVWLIDIFPVDPPNIYVKEKEHLPIV